MSKESVITAIRNGKSVTYCGDKVTLEDDYPWCEKSLWINFTNGSGFKAGWREVRSMEIA